MIDTSFSSVCVSRTSPRLHRSGSWDRKLLRLSPADSFADPGALSVLSASWDFRMLCSSDSGSSAARF